MMTEKKEEEKKKKKKEKEEKISHMCESIGHRPLRGRCPKGRKKESGARDIHNQTIEFNKIDEGMIRIMDWVALERMLSASFHSKFSYVQF